MKRFSIGLAVIAHSLGCAAPNPTDDAPRVTAATKVNRCVDIDNDGYGDGCVKGADCAPRDHRRNTDCGATREGERCEAGAAPSPCYAWSRLDPSAFNCIGGFRRCEAGKWSSCRLDAPGKALAALVDGPITLVPCDPTRFHARTYPKDMTELAFPGTAVTDLTLTANGLTVVSEALGTVDSDGDGTVDAADDFPNDNKRNGLTGPNDTLPAGVAGAFLHTLPFGDPEVATPLTVKPRLRSADVYFLMDNTVSMQDEMNQLVATLTSGSFANQPDSNGIPYTYASCPAYAASAQTEGIVGGIRCEIPDVQFGAGYFDDYPLTAGDGTEYGNPIHPIEGGPCDANGLVHDLPYGHILDVGPPGAALVSATQQYKARCGGDFAEGWGVALHAIATGQGVPDTRGSMPYLLTATVPNTSSTAAAAHDMGDVTTYASTAVAPPTWSSTDPGPPSRWDPSIRTFIGDTSAMVDTVRDVGCGASPGAPDAVLKFRASEQTDVMVSTGSFYERGTFDAPRSQSDPLHYTRHTSAPDFNTVVELRDAQFKPIACNNDFNGWTTGVDDFVVPYRGQNKYSTVFRRVPAGEYFVVITGTAAPNRWTGWEYPTAPAAVLLTEGITADRGIFGLQLSAWSKWWLPPRTCTPGKVGYPCFREGSMPIVVLITDNGYHAASRLGAAPDGALVGSDIRGLHEYARQVVGFAPYFEHMSDELRGAGVRVLPVVSIDSTPRSWLVAPRGLTGDRVCNGPSAKTCLVDSDCIAPADCSAFTQQICNQFGCTLIPVVGCSCNWVFGPLPWNVAFAGINNGAEWCADWLAVNNDPDSSCTGSPPSAWDPYGSATAYFYGVEQQSVREVARDTKAVDAAGEPLVQYIDGNGVGLGAKLVSAVRDLAQVSRVNIALQINDDPATATVDERNFVSSVVASLPAVSVGRCLGSHPTWFEQCLPGTEIDFSISFQNSFVPTTAADQVFNFTIDVLGDGQYNLGTYKVRIVVPGIGAKYAPEGRYSRIVEGNTCVGTERPAWRLLEWPVPSMSIPAGTTVRWELQSADTVADLATARVGQVTLTNPAPGNVNVDALFRAAGIPNAYRFVRVTAVLVASADLSKAPTVQGFELTYDCVASN